MASPSSRPSRGHGFLGAPKHLISLLVAAPAAMAANCVPLTDSTACSGWPAASIATDGSAVGTFNFLKYVTDTASFDKGIDQYIKTTYVQSQYQNRFGCGNIDLTNTTEYYGRFSTSVICNAIIQSSIEDCGLSADDTKPLCVESCAQYAESEAYIVANRDLCPSEGPNASKELRADLENCEGPTGAIHSAQCIPAIENESSNCGYGSSTLGLCSYCASGGINSTDTCCYSSDVNSKCSGVTLPTIQPITFSTPGPTSSPTGSASPSPDESANGGLSGGAIAGIVIGCVAGVALLALLIFFLCFRRSRRSNDSQKGSILNQPSPSRQGPPPAQVAQSTPATAAAGPPPQGYEVLPGGRIARMSALEGHSSDSPSKHGGSRHGGSTGTGASAVAAGIMGRRRGDDQSSSDRYGESPASEGRSGVLRPPPTTMRRNGSLSSNSLLQGEDPTSPSSNGAMSSPQGMGSQQSEQLPFFKDYYSQDDIHPGDRVAVLWAYQPRAPDEFSLERGDMLKVVGIWDDGWATGVMIDERAEEWEARRAQRDSGVSNTSARGRDISPPVSGEIKAFPLVCVCIPDHWRKTIEGDGSTDTTSTAPYGNPMA